MNRSNLADEVLAWIEADRPECAPVVAPATGKLTCPSYPDNSTGTRFAVRLADGSFQFLGSDADVDDLIEIQSNRLHGPCLTSRCAYWLGNCQLGVKISQVAVNQVSGRSVVEVINDCPIQKTCRWRAENGVVACHSCVNVSYEVEYE